MIIQPQLVNFLTNEDHNPKKKKKNNEKISKQAYSTGRMKKENNGEQNS